METTHHQEPKQQISVGNCYGLGWDIIFKTFIELLVITIVAAVIGIPSGAGFQIKVDEFHPLLIVAGMFAMAYGVFLSGPIGYSIDWVFLKVVRKEKIEIKDMFSVFERNYWNAVLAGIITMVIIIVGLIMLIVPGIIFACRLAFVPYLVIDRKMEAMEALKVSWDMTRGHGWKVFLIALLGILIVIAGLLVLIVGVLISIMWISTAYAVLYHQVSSEYTNWPEEVVLPVAE